MSRTSNPALDTNLAFSALGVFGKYFDAQEKKIADRQDKLAAANREIKLLSDVTNELSHAKRKKQPLDINKSQSLQRDILHIHQANPSIFSDLIQGLPENFKELSVEELLGCNLKFTLLAEEDIEALIQGLDSELKMHTSNVNELLLHINRAYDDQGQMVEKAKRVLEGQEGEISHILRKTTA